MGTWRQEARAGRWGGLIEGEGARLVERARRERCHTIHRYKTSCLRKQSSSKPSEECPPSSWPSISRGWGCARQHVGVDVVLAGAGSRRQGGRAGGDAAGDPGEEAGVSVPCCTL